MLSLGVNLRVICGAIVFSLDSSELERACPLGLTVRAWSLLLAMSESHFNDCCDESSGPASTLIVLVFRNGFLDNADIHSKLCQSFPCKVPRTTDLTICATITQYLASSYGLASSVHCTTSAVSPDAVFPGASEREASRR